MKTKWTFLNYAVVALSLLMTVSCSEDPDGDSGEADNSGSGVSIAVTLDSPAANAVDVSATPTFEWSVDSDLSGITYDVYTGTESTALYTEKTGLSVLTYTIEYAMPLGSTQYWKVVAKYDGEEFSSSVQSFTVETFDAPVITGPASGTDVGGDVTFTWEAIDETDITYTLHFLEMNNDEAVEFTIVVPTNDAESYTATDNDLALFTDLKSYEWWLTASDGANTSTSADVFTLNKVVAGAPSAPVLTSPENNTLFDMTTNSVSLEWDASIDPDGDPITYDIVVTKGTTTSTVSTAQSATTFSYDISGDADGTVYAWKVTANDGTGKSATSSTNTFYKSSSTDIPLAVNALATPGILALAEAFVWEDAGAGYTYTVKLYSDGAWATLKEADGTEVKGISATTYTLKNRMIACDLITGQKEFKIQIIGTDGTTTKTSAEISFKPQMEGTFTDTRGSESIEYDWVRVGPFVWMQTNLMTKYLNDGTALDCLTGVSLPTDVSYESFYTTEILEHGYDIPNVDMWTGTIIIADDESVSSWTADSFASTYAYYNFFTGSELSDYEAELEKFIAVSGYSYPLWTANNDNIAPKNWRVPTEDDLLEWHLYYGLDTGGIINHEWYSHSKLMDFMDDTYFGGTNASKLSLVPSMYRIAQYPGWSSTACSGYGKGRWQYQGNLWVLNKTNIDYLLSLDSANAATEGSGTTADQPGYNWYFGLRDGDSGASAYGVTYYVVNSTYLLPIRCIME